MNVSRKQLEKLRSGEREYGPRLEEAAYLEAGELAECMGTGCLNPEFVAWLMGFPVDLLYSVPWGTLSSRKSRSGSSPSSNKQKNNALDNR